MLGVRVPLVLDGASPANASWDPPPRDIGAPDLQPGVSLLKRGLTFHKYPIE